MGINRIKYAQYLMKEFKELSEWKDIPRSCKGRLRIEMSILPPDLQVPHDPNQNLNELFCRYQQSDYKIHTKAKDSEWPTQYCRRIKVEDTTRIQEIL